ncbi:hypothetical protein [Chryseobacterium sp. RU37D]|uniref:hypothetical protein n=1 Tax=Chryseobacterium sp. RU37D TaxID=1907397 RepID=UPI001E4937F3|nr:hypothetical protein [Chryseobacterium sp. RU37D]
MHSCRNEKVHAFKDYLEDLNKNHDWLFTHIFYETIDENFDHKKNNSIKQGRIDLSVIKDEILIDNAKYYICGPEAFIKVQYNSLVQLGISKEDIYFEEFGPQLIQLN